MLELKSWGYSLNEQNKNGNTPLHLLAANGHWSKLSALAVDEADLSIENNAHQTPVQLAEAAEQRKRTQWKIRMAVTVAMVAVVVFFKIG